VSKSTDLLLGKSLRALRAALREGVDWQLKAEQAAKGIEAHLQERADRAAKQQQLILKELEDIEDEDEAQGKLDGMTADAINKAKGNGASPPPPADVH
jgi:uncharacterized Fe-S cluster-containing protein